ncbi:MAG: hydrolase [Rubrivivax sp. SCN 71-131]|nr:MAG: hydrolase [Rubrivivax sp. SCN 71-131]
MNAPVDLPQAREVCPTTTRRLLGEGALLVDVRERTEVARLAFDVPGVVVMPLSEFEQRFAELPRDCDLVLACESGPRSLKATYFLMFQGYTRVANMDGGIQKWARKGYPVQGTRATGPDALATAGSCCGTAPTAAATGPCCAPATAASSCCGPAATPQRQGGSCC